MLSGGRPEIEGPANRQKIIPHTPLAHRNMALGSRFIADKTRVPGIFWLILLVICAYAVAGPAFWYLGQAPWRLSHDSIYIALVVSIGGLVGLIAIQLRYAPKVFPLWYLIPTLHMVVVQVVTTMVSSAGLGVFWLALFLFVLNLMWLALSWNEMNNSTRSVAVEPWASIVPISSLLTLSSAGIQNAIYRPGSSADAFFAPWMPIIWIACAFGIMALVMTKGPDWRKMGTGEAFSGAFLALVLLTLLLGPIAWGISGFNFMIGWVVLTLGIMEFGVASAKFDDLMRFESGRGANAIAFVFGSFLALICVLSPWVLSV